MGNLANGVFSFLLGWLKSTIAALWEAFQAGSGTNLLTWVGQNWKALTLILLLAGTAADIVVHLFRWRPLTVWRCFFRRCFHKDEPPQVEVVRETVYADGTSTTENVYRPADEYSSWKQAASPMNRAAIPEAETLVAEEEAPRKNWSSRLTSRFSAGMTDAPDPRVQPPQAPPSAYRTRIYPTDWANADPENQSNE